ncbi:hypothetical protein BU17DRAFT_50360 [Hysterangium stoloniferum]|nr:hypothetical protein BU17DRAFT_50360 [Hysterangium stoloniferum]
MFSIPTWQTFPSIFLPATIQRRFVSFILKRVLGHLVKPGQLDPTQIEAQIGSGLVEVHDVELDHDAINSQLSSISLPFTLQSGSIGKVSACLPWPNVLTAPMALSLSSLSLTLVCSSGSRTTHPDTSTTNNLAESVASMAELFVHDELTEGENELLQKSIHVDESRAYRPPGSLDPFLSTEDLESGCEREHDEDDIDHYSSTQGVSLIATLIERLLGRFEFDAADTTIRFIVPATAELVLTLGQLSYRTEDSLTSPPSSDTVQDGGVVRSVRLGRISVSTRDLTSCSTSSSTIFHQRPSSDSDSSLSSDDGGDEATMMMMSQSLASLPPQYSSHSVSLSPESSMYHSATSSIRSPSPGIDPVVESNAFRGEKVLSLDHGPDSVVIKLMTPRVVASSHLETSADDRKRSIPSAHLQAVDRFHLTISIAPIAIAVNPIQATSLVHICSAFTVAQQSALTPVKDVRVIPTNTLDIKLHVRSLTFAFFLSPLATTSQLHSDTLKDFFAHPASTSATRSPHFRIHLDTLEISSFSEPEVMVDPTTGISKANPSPDQQQKRLIQAHLNDLWALAFISSPTRGLYVSPVLISDPYLITQYEANAHLPSFDTNDWTQPHDSGKNAKFSQWRVRPPQLKRKSQTVSTNKPGHNDHAIRAQFSMVNSKDAVCDIEVIPLHLFLDLGIFEHAVTFISLMSLERVHVKQSDIDNDGTPPATPRAGQHNNAWSGKGEGGEKERLEDLLIQDFLKTDDPRSDLYQTVSLYWSRSHLLICVQGVNLHFLLIRTEIRVPSPPRLSAGQRSGVIILDFHGARISHQMGSTWSDSYADSLSRRQAVPRLLGKLGLKRLIIALALSAESRASTFLSIASGNVFTQDTPSSFGVSTSSTIPPFPSSGLSLCLRSNVISLEHPHTTSPHISSSYSLDSHFPVLHLTLSKPTLDGLTYWVDDLTQCLEDIERASTSGASERSRDPSMIGSRYFGNKAGSNVNSELGDEARKSELVVKVYIGEAYIMLLVPRQGQTGVSRPIELKIMDTDFLAEVKPDGNEETVVTIGLMDLLLSDTSSSGESVTILRLTIPRDVFTPSKSLIKLRYISAIDTHTNCKESRFKLSVAGITYYLTPDVAWISDLGLFAKNPQGTFESVIPSERTKVFVKLTDGSFHISSHLNSGAAVLYIGELDFTTDLIGDSVDTTIDTNISNSCVLFIDELSASTSLDVNPGAGVQLGSHHWKQYGYALFADVDNAEVRIRVLNGLSPYHEVTIIQVNNCALKLHACADTIPALTSFIGDFHRNSPLLYPSIIQLPFEEMFLVNDFFTCSHSPSSIVIVESVDENAFTRMPDFGPAPDMIYDDLPKNSEYLNTSFGAAGRHQELEGSDMLGARHSSLGSTVGGPQSTEDIISNFGGETIRMLDSRGIRLTEGYFENIQEDTPNLKAGYDNSQLAIRVQNCNLTISLYDGYDWLRTRQTIEQEVKAIRRRLVKIRQLLASGQTPDDSIERTSAVLFNSVSIGLPDDPEDLEPIALMAAIDRELNEDDSNDEASQSSWQSFKPQSQQHTRQTARFRGRKLDRSKGSQIDFRFFGIQVDMDRFQPTDDLVSRSLIAIRDVEILDHIKTSTWKKFLTELRTDFRGNQRETDSNMVRIELRMVRPVPKLPSEEGRLRAKILPIKLHVDQDALDFMKKFFSFKNQPMAPVTPEPAKDQLYFQHVEIFPVDLKLDYKPKRVDYKALREGKTIELMNFFHFDGSEITLRHITLSGIAGWPRLFDTLNDLWTPDVKANQLADIISGVSPVRSFVNVGAGVADLVLLPIAQYKKDKRVVRGVQKGATSFIKSTAMEAVKLGARLATGTQVILEQAEVVLGGQGQFKDTIMAEALQSPRFGGDDDEDVVDLISRYADQPQDVREGMQSAYKSLSRNLNSAAQTILAIPMEVYERSGSEGPVRAVIRAVPIAVLKPMIGASEAVSKTLFGLQNTMDPNVKHDNEAKYKQR